MDEQHSSQFSPVLHSRPKGRPEADKACTRSARKACATPASAPRPSSARPVLARRSDVASSSHAAGGARPLSDTGSHAIVTCQRDCSVLVGAVQLGNAPRGIADLVRPAVPAGAIALASGGGAWRAIASATRRSRRSACGARSDSPQRDRPRNLGVAPPTLPNHESRAVPSAYFPEIWFPLSVGPER